MKRARADGGAPFTFLSDAPPPPLPAASPPLAPLSSLPLSSSPGSDAVLTAALEPTFGGPPLPFHLPAGSRVRVDWSSPGSVGGYVEVAAAAGGPRGRIPSRFVRLLPAALDAALGAASWLQGDFSGASAEQFDLTLGASGCRLPPPLVLEPGLDALCFPVRPADFCARFLGARALCVHGGAARLSELSAALHGFDVAAMLREAPRVVAWAREAGGARRMQYLEVPAEVGHALHAAGHSLYFNPPAALQERFLRELVADLGLCGGLDGPEAFGGDIEVFAVRGRHHTPWHFDAQENFTVQCTGTKRWRLARGAVHAPLTNLHPASSNAAALADDVLLHAAGGWAAPPAGAGGGGGGEDAPPPPPPGAGEVVTVLLRPGSTLYVPAGWWHSVDAEDEGGSVSLNFSVGGARWGDLLLRALAQRLWREAGWRARVTGLGAEGGGGGARAQLGALLSALPAVVAALTPEALLPGAAVEDGGGAPATWRVRGGSGAVDPPVPELRGAPALRRNGLAHLCVEAGGGGPALAFTVRSLFAAGGFSDARASGGFSWRVEAPARLRGAVARLAALGAREEAPTAEALARAAPDADAAAAPKEELEGLLSVLAHVGFLCAAPQPR